MPRPPILPVPDRAAIFNAGVSFEEWLDRAPEEEQENAGKMRAAVADVQVPHDAGLACAHVPRPVKVIAFAECWCGDVVLHTPVLMALANCSDKIEVSFLARAENPDYFARFLTNGGEAVPKFVFLNEACTEVGSWGPMPSTPRKLIAMGKGCGDVATARKKVSAFYQFDEHRETIAELVDLIETASFPGW